MTSAYLILACGGKAGPTFGTTGDGYGFARSLGHSIVTPVPVLTPVECSEWGSRDNDAVCLAGTRTRGKVTLIKNTDGGAASSDGAELFMETGEIQFTKYGLSGICIFNMTRHMRYDRSKGESLEDFAVRADLFPDGDITEFLRDRQKHAFSGEKTADVLRTVLKANIAGYVLKKACGEACDENLAEKEVGDLTDADILAISHQVHGLTFHPERLKGWKEAQATSGGVSLDELDPVTGGSLITPGLFITGELADRDYMCGGFNLSNAWLTGIGAAHAILTSDSHK
jgi:predicted Rossmann fold flavoprotein